MSNNFLHANKYKQRALIFQGGGALGVYEAGVFKEIHRKVIPDQEQKGNNNIKLFDMVSGTSIGAINATVLVGHFLKNNKNSGTELLTFPNSILRLTIENAVTHEKYPLFAAQVITTLDSGGTKTLKWNQSDSFRQQTGQLYRFCFKWRG